MCAIAGSLASAQTYTVLHDFTGGDDGGTPFAGLTPEASGFYGTTTTGGSHGLGTAYRLAHPGDTWRVYALYAFDGLDNLRDGVAPYSGLAIGPDDLLYGTTHGGGQGNGCMQRYGCGTVFRIKPGAAIANWDESILYGFGNTDGSNPDHGDLVFDHTGNLYGTTRNGGASGQGTVFELTSNRGIWTETVLRSFAGPDGASPLSGIAFDQQGNLYGTTSAGGADGMGTVYRLQPSGSGWIADVLYSFANGADGNTPVAGLIVDASGNLYGATQSGGTAGGGTVFELSPRIDGNWNFATLTALSGAASGGPYSNLIMDASGNLYGTTAGDGSQHFGSVFKLTWSNGTWSYRSLHDFTGGADGGVPYSSLVLDANGNLYGTTSEAGAYGQGVIFEITP
jgi:uncharacterized repeat protein (TIGR03803 family)